MALKEGQKVVRTTDGKRGEVRGLRAEDGCARIEFDDGTARLVQLPHLKARSDAER